ncbi:putative T7SS-secreted protein [Streptomyces sp. NPDC053542]|uniref:putative T7SS-secreted protein n=1 Tax=Streptomyces sp. NPDC053542 TaxID=3365710 RepID=UPI0037D4B7D8
MATRPGDWGALGLDGDPTPGDAAAITAIADAMRDLATNAGTINNGLKALQQTAGDGRRFIGKTADQLRDMVDDHLHNFVGHVEDSFHQAEAALRTYATAVTDAQSDADQALSAIQGLADDDPQRQTHIDRADEAKTALSNAASTLDKALTAAGSLMVQPVSDCDMFWEAFEWLTIVLSVIAIFTGGVLAVLAWGMNAVLLIKTIVDFSQGKASGLELGLAFLGVLFPTTKALPVGSIVKGLGGVLKGGFEGIAGAGKNIFAEIGHFSSLHGMPKVVVAPMVIAAHAAPALNIVNGVKGLGNLAKGGWESLAGTFAKDWATFTGHIDGSWAKIGAYAKVNFGRGGRIAVATVLPLDFTEMGVLGFGGAARLAFGERVLGIKQPELHALLANAGRTDAALRGGVHTGAFGGPGALVPFRPIGGTGAPFVPGGFVNLSGLHLGAAAFPGGFPGAHFTPGGLGAFTPNGLGAFTPNGLGAFTPNGLGAFTPNGLGAFSPNGLGGTAPNGITVPHGITAPQGITAPNGSVAHAGPQVDQPGLVTVPDVPGMTTHANGLTVPDVHGSGATQLIQQADFAAGHIRLDNNLLLPADTAIDLLKDTHAASPLAHTDAPAVRVPETSFDAGSVHGIGDGHAMARGAVGHGEALEDMTFPELQALASGDVAVTAFHGDGVSIRIGDAATRTFTAQDLANTVPGGQAATIRPAGAGTHAETVGLHGAVPPQRDPVKAPVDIPATAGAYDPLRLKTPDAAPSTKAVPSSGTAPTTNATPQPALNQHDLAMSLLDAGDRKPAPATGHSATGHSVTSYSGPSGVSARPDLDGAGASGIADHSALDLIAHPGGDVSKAADAAAVPAAVKATEHTPTPVPAPAPKAGSAPTPASGPKDSGPVTAPPRGRFGGFSGAAAMNQRLRARHDLILGGSTGPEAGAKLNAWAGYENALSQLGKAERKVDELTPPGAAQGKPTPALAEALDDLGVKRAEAAEAEARLDELGIDAARTRKQINALTGGLFGEHGLGGGPHPHPHPQPETQDPLGSGPGTGRGARDQARHDIVTGGASGPEAELRLDAWGQYQRASYDLAGAQGKVDRLVPKAGQPGPSKPSAAALDALDDLSAKRAEFTEAETRLGELGMDPQALRQQIDDANNAIAAERAQRGEYVGPLGGAPTPHPGPRDVEMTDAQPGPSAQGGGNHQPPGLRWDNALTRGTTPGDIRANTAFQNLRGLDQRPLSGADYLANLHDSLREQRPLSFVVNTVVKYDQIGGGQLDAFLRAVTTGLPDSYRGRFGVVIGLNGPAGEMARINAAVRHALDGVQAEFPIAVVGVGWRGGDFPYGTVRNTVMTSPASRSMVHAMMAGGAGGAGRTHPYFAFMDFDDFPHTVPSGRHIFDYFEKKFEMRGVERAGEPSSAEPLRPLTMFGGYRVPEPPGGGLPDPLLVKTDDHLAKAEAKGKGKATDTPRQPGELRVTQENRITFDLRIRADMRARVGIAGRHPLLPYAPEPNLFVDATATLVDTMPGVHGWLPLRYGPGGAEYHQLSRALNHFNAWELDTTLPRFTRDDFPRLPGESQDDWDKRVADGITDREAQREIAAGNHTLPARGTAFVAEFEKAAIPTDLSRIMASLFGKSGKLLQDHAGLGNVERLVVNKDAKRGMELKDVRDDRFKLSPEAADHDNPLRPVESPDQERPRDVAARLTDKLGTGANPLGGNVSAGLPSDPSIRAGIRQEDLRIITHGYAHNEDPSRFLDLLDYAIVHTSHQSPPTSVLHAFENAPDRLGLPAPEDILRGVRAQLEYRGTVAKSRVEAAVNDAIARGTDGRELSIALTTGRLRRENFLPDGLGGATGRTARNTAEDLALTYYANALGRELHITFADGSMTTIAPTKPGKKRLPPPVEIVWTTSTDTVRYPDGGHWTVADNEPGPVAGGKRGRGGADGPGGDTHTKRPRKGKGRADGPADPDTPMGGIQ